jgi:hypothetical protein
MMRFVIAAAALLSATPAFATDWVLATQADDNSSAIFVDRDSVQRNGGMVQAETFYALAVDKDDGLAAIGLRQEYDCTGRRFRRLYIRSFLANGSVKFETEYVTDWKRSEPGDQGAGMLDFICNEEYRAQNTLSVGSQFPLDYARNTLFR